MKTEELNEILKIQAPVFQNVERPADSLTAPYAVIPDGMSIKALKDILDEYLPKPERRHGIAVMENLVSFIGLTNRFKSETSVLFCKGRVVGHEIRASIQAVLNYHPEGGNNFIADNADHIVSYNFPVSKELQRWIVADDKPMNQKEFAEFLEDNGSDLVMADDDRWAINFGQNKPRNFATPSDILQLSFGLDVRVDEKVHQTVRLANGTQSLQYTTEHKDSDGKPLIVPEWFAIGVKVFEDGASYQIAVRLRYRVTNGQVSFRVQIFRLQDIFDAAFTHVVDEAQKKTERPLFRGSPE